ncbi:pantoate--beta-alanine ligase [Paenibacillus sp. MER 99-2]|uniref:pantoate--beta-alanine ligase n=1 Tax=Paenibacillus sp. MER 99-2 TaxID=2939572 RepID=UPI00203C5018|nr:pantoate--beta-alanine ligase [Paenibacillus sp. MER 99-2]MCM3171491.1 pantoate--beta-alanine ligase [Paenibacillus sp. MER 99-2]
MKVIRTITEVRQEISRLRQSMGTSEAVVGFVPTMGYLHEGHASLMRAAKEQSDIVVLSIFVNPIQFGPNEDFDSYPRDEARDVETARLQGVDIVFIPSVNEMYPEPTQTTVSVSQLTDRLCGASRPGHFDGVTTVVSKLFNIVQPQRAFFGMKDAQQVAVIQQMVNDLNMAVEIVPCPIVRESDGLALSSRNVYLSAEQREQALVLSQALRSAQETIDTSPSVTAEDIRVMLRRVIQASPLAVIDYAEIQAFPSLQPLADHEKVYGREDVLIALAVKFGKTRLIDNIKLHKSEVLSHV